MQRKIWQLANGKFDFPEGNIMFSEAEVVLYVRAGASASGEFYLSASDGGKIRGIVNSTNPYMECLTEGFDGEEPKIRYEFHSLGFAQGDTVRGEFVVLTDRGEDRLSFVVNITGVNAEASKGRVTNLREFTALYEASPKEAYRIFYSPLFEGLLENNMQKLNYMGFIHGPAGYNAIEEFLIACDEKKPTELGVFFPYSGEKFITEIVEETLTVEKKMWGHTKIVLSCNHPAVAFKKKEITDEDFIGSVAEIKVQIDPELFHGGKNEIKITVNNSRCSKDITFFARRTEKATNTVQTDIQNTKAKIASDYISYRLKQMMTGEWAARTLPNLDHLIAVDTSTAWYSLMRAQVFIANRQKQEALCILRDFKNERFDRGTVLWAYYLYLSTLVEKERSYVDKLTAEIENIFKKNPEDARLFWMLLFLRVDYQTDSSAKFAAIRHWIENQNASPFLYIEAYFIAWQNPAILSSADEYTLNLLHWARRHDCLTRDMCIQILNLASLDRRFQKKTYDLLVYSYRKYSSEEFLSAACSYIVRFGQTGEEYLDILGEGIVAGISITGIYESYLASVNPSDVLAVPRALCMYFGFDHKLPDRLKIILYANVVLNKNNEPEIYAQYEKAMEVFALDCIRLGRIDDNLAIIYDDFLSKNTLTDDIARNMSEIMLTVRMPVLDEDARRVFIYEEPYQVPKETVVRDGVCYFSVSAMNTAIIVEDKYGYRYALNNPTYERVVGDDEILRRLAVLSKDSLPYAVWYVERIRKCKNFKREDTAFFETIISDPVVSEKYIGSIYPLLLKFLSDQVGDDQVEQWLEKGIDLSILSPADRGFIINLLVDYHFDDVAFEAIRTYGTYGVSAAMLMVLMSYEITKSDLEFDEELFFYARVVFGMGLHNDVLTQYLCEYYTGAIDDMIGILEIAKNYSLNVHEIAERIITFLLFSGSSHEKEMQVFEEYFTTHPSEDIVEAFLSSRCHDYLVGKTELSTALFGYLLSYNEDKLNDTCRIGLLKYLANKEELGDEEFEIADHILYELLSRGIMFAFFKQLDYSLIEHYHLYDKTVAEHHDKSGLHVTIHYEEEGNRVSEEMQEVYTGVYVKPFVLFFGEEKKYYVVSEDEEGNETTYDEKTLLCRDVLEKPSLNRFEKLNRIAMDYALDNRDRLAADILEYEQFDNVCETLFTFLG